MWKRKKIINKSPLPGDEGFLWPPPVKLPPPPLPPKKKVMEIRVVESVPIVRKDILLSYEEIEILVDAMNGYYAKYMNRIARTEQPRTKKESIELGQRQQLFQRLALIRNKWEETDEPRADVQQAP